MAARVVKFTEADTAAWHFQFVSSIIVCQVVVLNGCVCQCNERAGATAAGMEPKMMLLLLLLECLLQGFVANRSLAHPLALCWCGCWRAGPVLGCALIR
jgi:hypothetical protein